MAKKKPSAATLKEVDALAAQYAELAKVRRDLGRLKRKNKKQIGAIEKKLQALIGTSKKVDCPHVFNSVKTTITQILLHRDVDSYSYDFIEFKVFKK